MVIHNPILTGSFTVNNIDVSSITSSAANITALNATTASLNASTASLNTFSSSVLTFTGSVNTFTGSASTRLGALEAATASLYTATSSFSERVGALESYTASQTLRNATYATTGSNTLTGTQYVSNTNNAIGFSNTTSSIYTDGGLQVTKDAYISSSLYIKGNLTVYGTQSVSYISSSTLNVGTNLITVNTATPSVRFGGIAVQDSGSTSGLTGSLLWDSQNNNWLYDNPSGSGNYDSAMLIMGPRNSSALGSEVGLNCNYLVQGHGSHHTTSSAIFHDGTNTCIPNTLIGGTICSTMGNHSCLGIGTQTPSCVLDVVGTGRITVSGGNNLILSKASGPSINFQKTTATAQTWSLTTDPNFRITDDTAVTVPFQITLGTGAATFACNVQSATLSVGGTATADQLSVINGTSNSFATMRLVGSNRGGQINFYNQSYPTAQISVDQSGNIDFSTGVYAGSSVSSKISLTNTGQVCFACQVCTPHLIGLNNVSIGSSCTSSDGYNTRLRITNIPNDTFVFSFNNQACKAIMYMYGGNTNNPQGYTAWLDNTSGNTNHAISHNTAEHTSFAVQGGNVGIGTSTPATKLEIKGTNTYHKVATCFFSTYNAGFAFSDYLAGLTYDAGGNTFCLYSNYANYGGIVLSTATVPRLVVSNNGATRTIMNGISTAVLQQSYNTGNGGCINVCFDIYNAIPGKGNGYIFQADIYVSGYGSAGSSGLVYRASVGGYDGHYVGVGGYHQYSEQVKCAMGVAIALYNPSGSPCLLGVTIYNCNGSYTHTGTMRMVITY